MQRRKKYVVWGAGEILPSLGDTINLDAINKVDYFVDSDESKWDTTHFGKPVKSPHVLLSEDKECVMVIVGVYERHSEIEFHLRQMGFIEGINYVWFVTFKGDENLPCFINRKTWNEEVSLSFTSESYEVRTRIALESVCWDNVKSVLDLGAGLMKVKKYIPNDVSYTPVDCVKRVPETVLCDFNKREFPAQTADLVLAIGVLGYVSDWRWFLDKMSGAVNANGSLIITVSRLDRWLAFNFSHISLLFESEAILHLQKQNFILSGFRDWQMNTSILCFNKI